MIIQAASRASSSPPAPGFFLLAWGLFASVVGLGLVTNYRGFADKFAQQTYESTAGLRRLPPWKWIRERPESRAARVKRARLLAIPFAVAGPIVTIAGVVQVLRGHIAIPRGPTVPLPFAVAFICIALVAMGQCWRRGGFYREAARKGGWRRAAAMVASVCILAFSVFVSVGQLTLAIVGWLVGGLLSVPLVMRGKPSSPGGADKGPASR